MFIGGETLGGVAAKDEGWFGTEESGIGRVAEEKRVEAGRSVK